MDDCKKLVEDFLKDFLKEEKQREEIENFLEKHPECKEELEKQRKELEKQRKELEKQRKELEKQIKNISSQEEKKSSNTTSDSTENQSDDNLSDIQMIKIDIDKPEKFKKVLQDIANKRKIELQQKIFEAIAELDREKYQQKIFEAIAELDRGSLEKLYGNFLLETYKYFISYNSIDKDFIKNHLGKFVKAIDSRKDLEENSVISDLRNSLYKLVLKIKREDLQLYVDAKLDTVVSLYNDLHRKNLITLSNRYRIREKNTKKLIEILRNSTLSKKQYQKILLEISKRRIYAKNHTMFDLVLYVYSKLSSRVEILDTHSRYSYDFYQKYKNNYRDKLFLDELFTPSGFGFHSFDDEKNIISFATLYEATYVANKVRQKEILEKYKKHPNKLYLHYAFSLNSNFNKSTFEPYLKYLDNLTYPYDDDIELIIHFIRTNINKKFYISKNSSEASENKDTQIPTTKPAEKSSSLLEGYPVLAIEKYARDIKLSKSESMLSYFAKLENFISYLMNDNAKMIFKLKNFRHYGFYISDLLDSDYRLVYYEEFYLKYIIRKLKKGSILFERNHEIRYFLSYLKIQTLKLALTEVLYLQGDKVQKEILRSKKKIYIEKFKQQFPDDVYEILEQKYEIKQSTLDEIIKKYKAAVYKEWEEEKKC